MRIHALDVNCVLGECPLWHSAEQVFYWTDIEAGQLYRLNLPNLRAEVCYEGPKVGGFTVQQDGSLLLFRDRGNIAVWRDGAVVAQVIDEIEEVVAVGGRFNDVLAAPDGSVLCGSCSPQAPGKLYRLEPDGSLSTLLENVGMSNGMAFYDNGARFLHTDSGNATIRAYRFGSAPFGEGQPWLDLSAGPGVPDGLTIDADDQVWSARWEGGGVFVYSLQGQELRFLQLPTPKCTSVTFGGPELDTMLVTTAQGPAFLVEGAGRGRPEHRSRITHSGASPVHLDRSGLD